MTGVLAAGELATLTREQRTLLFERLRRKRERPAAEARIPRRSPGLDAVPPSFTQERFWFLDRLQPGSPAYNLPFAVALRGALAPAALEAALNEVVRRHEALRTVFGEADRQPLQIVLPHARRPLPVVDLSALPAAARAATVRRLALSEGRRPFDLERGPLLRAALLRRGPEEHALLLNLHHIVADGWSLGVLARELGVLHEAVRRGRPSPLPELPLQYPDFALWQRALLRDEALAGHLAYWRGRLAGAAVLDLPTDRPRPPLRSSRGASRLLAVDAPAAEAVRTLARRHEATGFIVLLAAFQAVLGRAAGQRDVVVGSPVASRSRAETEPLIGPFVNTLALRGDLSGDPPFGELVARARRSAVEAFTHQDLPFERLVEELQPERRLAQNPLFQVVLALQDPPLSGLDLPGLALSQLDLETSAARFDLELVWNERGEAPAVQLIFGTALFDPATVLRLWHGLETLLAAAAAAPERRLSELPACREPERHQLLAEWNDTAAAPPAGTLASLFAEQVRRRPDAVALSAGEGDLTYAELERRADRLARRLAAAGVGPEARVALLARRSPALIVGMLGIAKAGGAYVPLDPADPAGRLAWMLADSGARVLLGEPELIPEGFAALEVLALAADPEDAPGPDPAGALPDGLACLLYTSGSTGRPKGVGVTHRNVVRLVRAGGFADLGPDQAFLQLAPASFDASTLEIWAPLLNGGRLAVFPARRPSLEELGEAVSRFGVTTLWLTAGLFHQMVDARLEDLRPLRQLLAGGDVLSPAHVRRALSGLPEVTLINGYGPTEATTFTCCAALTEAAAAVPIGRPIGNTRALVLGPDLRPAPCGAWGELFAGGDGVARGYPGSPGLTAERFVPDPFAAPGGAGARLYRTGDIVRSLPDGRLEFRGRRDGQVKLRGFRVELGEIECALARHPRVAAAAVAARDDGGAAGRRLVAWVVPRPHPPGDLVPELRRFLASALPDYMLPSAFVLLDALPLTANGKLDRAALPEPGAPAAKAWIAPATPLEELLAQAAAELLGVERVGMGDNFFDLGGHSLLATQLVSRLTQDHGLPMTLQMVFDSPTFADLADRMVEHELAGASDELLGEVLDGLEADR